MPKKYTLTKYQLGYIGAYFPTERESLLVAVDPRGIEEIKHHLWAPVRTPESDLVERNASASENAGITQI